MAEEIKVQTQEEEEVAKNGETKQGFKITKQDVFTAILGGTFVMSIKYFTGSSGVFTYLLSFTIASLIVSLIKGDEKKEKQKEGEETKKQL